MELHPAALFSSRNRGRSPSSRLQLRAWPSLGAPTCWTGLTRLQKVLDLRGPGHGTVPRETFAPCMMESVVHAHPAPSEAANCPCRLLCMEGQARCVEYASSGLPSASMSKCY